MHCTCCRLNFTNAIVMIVRFCLAKLFFSIVHYLYLGIHMFNHVDGVLLYSSYVTFNAFLSVLWFNNSLMNDKMY